MKTFKTILLLTLVFGAGVVLGVVGTRIAVRHIVATAIAHPERVQTVIERRMARQLRLDKNQQVKLHEILNGTHTQLKDLREQYSPEFTSIVSNANVQITGMLTNEQQTRFEKFKENNSSILNPLREN